MTTSPIELKQKNICLYITLSVSDPWIWRFWPDREQSGKPCEFRKKLEQRGPLQHFLTMIIQIETGGVWLRQPPWSFSSSRGQSEIVRLTAILSKDKDLSKMNLTWRAWLLKLWSRGKDACWHSFNPICDLKHMKQGKKGSSCSLQWNKLPTLQKKDTTDRG